MSCPSSYRKRRLSCFLLGGLFILLQGCASAPPVSPSDEARVQAKIAYLLSDYQKTLVIVLPRAEAGEAWAQYTVGYLYYYGRGVVQNKQTGKRWIESAAKKGYPPAVKALQRLAMSKPKTGEQGLNEPEQAPPSNSRASTSEPTATKQTAPEPDTTTTLPPPESPGKPAEQVKPAKPMINESSPDHPQEAAPTNPMTEPSNAPKTITPPPAQDEIPTPGNESAQGPDSSQASPEPMPPQSAVPSSNETVSDRPTAITSQRHEVKGRDWISQQDPHHFTLQLASSIDEDAIVRFIHKHHIETHAAYYSTRQNGRTWYSLVYGNYPSRSSANRAMHNLPRTLCHNSPRIRSFREIYSQFN